MSAIHQTQTHEDNVVDEKLDQQPTHATYYEPSDLDALSPEHREFLMSRHGTVELDPIPDGSDADPYNWPKWKKVTNLLLVAFHAMIATFTAAAIQSAYVNISEDLGVSVQDASYLTSVQIAVLGGAPLFWRPLSNRYGRRPIFMLSLIFSAVCNIGCANCPTWNSMMAVRALTAFFISPAAAIGSAVVQETFFKRERARYMGIWTLFVTLGVPVAPFLFGFVAVRIDYRWIYYILAITNGVQLVFYIFLGPETRYIRRGGFHPGSIVKQEYFQFRRIDPSPFRAIEFISPLFMAARPNILIPAVAYAVVFLLASVLVTVEVAQLFATKFDFNAQQLGYQFIGVIIGSVIGEQLSGPLSDIWMRGSLKKKDVEGANGRAHDNEHRLWLGYPGFLLVIVGLIVFLIQLNDAPDLHWNVTPLVGIAIAAAGNQIITTTMITYAVDCYPNDAASVGVFITFTRQIIGFEGPFWFPEMFDNVGLPKSSIITTVLVIIFSVIPTALLQLKGRSWRN